VQGRVSNSIKHSSRFGYSEPIRQLDCARDAVEPVTGIEPAYSAWGSAGFTAAFADVRHRHSR
jgi:hypothetical protein